MNYILITMANFVLGTLSKLPSHEIEIDLSVFTTYLSNINYFIPFYLIAPIMLAWSGFLALLIAVIAVWGFIKRNF